MIDSQQPRVRAIGPGLLVFLGAISVLGPLSMSIVLPGLPEMAVSLGATESAVQVSLSACVIGLAVGQLVAGPLSDSVGRRLPLLVGLAVWTVVTALCAFAPTVEVMIALRLVQGLTGGVGMAIGRAVVRDLADGDELVRQYSRLALVSGVAPVVSPSLGTLVMLVAPWQGIFVALAVGGCALLVYLLVRFRESLPASRRRPPGLRRLVADYRALLGSWSYVAPTLVVGFAYAAMFSYVLSSSFVFREAYAVPAAVFSILFGVNGAGFAVASQLGSRLALRFGVVRVVVTTLPVTFAACATMGILSLAGVGEWWALAAPLFVMVTSLGVVMPLGMTWAMRSQPERAGAASGLLGLGQFAIGGAIGPVVGLFPVSNPLALAAVTACCVLLALGITSTARSR
ncbi:multidrug effflux MFS transporter [Herbiconiux moechotypicola]|uniref:Multidrug effflux MFS transporter n=1 Tax=Herbiconiux moechotypicola TaxID=637393 RepID=A0ABP5QJP6_9MICO|nr:multidrug effflux MFS transporter [Herbiconiux moechotypicola]MCS5730053.1 multidrug effflux MFS transporter [Herbiconiux moechotypicola]